MTDAQPVGIVAADVTAWSKEPASPNLDRIVAAVNAYVGRLRVVADVPEGEPWPAEVKLGAVMLAARLMKRRNSPNGIEAATDMNVTYTARYDADISRLLGIDGFAGPAVG